VTTDQPPPTLGLDADEYRRLSGVAASTLARRARGARGNQEVALRGLIAWRLAGGDASLIRAAAIGLLTDGLRCAGAGCTDRRPALCGRCHYQAVVRAARPEEDA